MDFATTKNSSDYEMCISVLVLLSALYFAVTLLLVYQKVQQIYEMLYPPPVNVHEEDTQPVGLVIHRPIVRRAPRLNLSPLKTTPA